MKITTTQGLSDRIAALPANSRVVASGNFATPKTLLEILDSVLPEYRLFILNPQAGIPNRQGVQPETVFVGAGMRRNPNLSYIPCRLSMVPRLFGATMPPDVVLIHTTTPRNGQLSLGVEVNILPAAIQACRARGGLVIAQANPRMPWTYGDSEIHIDDVDLLIEVDEPLAEHQPGTIDNAALGIGSQVASLVPDGATVQAGIGAVPDAVLHSLDRHRELRIWTEMFSDGVLTLERAGVLDDEHPLVTSFLFGSQELYDWADNNRRVRMLRSERTNSPTEIARQRMMTSVNTAIQIDLYGQANASRVNNKIYSGFGGQADFVAGAVQSSGGQAIMALRSWHPKAGVSTVVPMVDEPVTSFQPNLVVTEQGIARLWGVDEREQAARIINHAAHPNAREELWGKAIEQGLADPVGQNTVPVG